MSKKEEIVKGLVKPRYTFDEVYPKFLEDFESSAMSIDSSRGFDLTSVKAQYVVERLNQVCGFDGWNHSSAIPGTGYQLTEDGKGVLYFGQLLIDNGVRCIARQSVGYALIKKNVGDAYKAAKTDSLSKCASMIGIANEVYKGNVSLSAKVPLKTASGGTGSAAKKGDF